MTHQHRFDYREFFFSLCNADHLPRVVTQLKQIRFDNPAA